MPDFAPPVIAFLSVPVVLFRLGAKNLLLLGRNVLGATARFYRGHMGNQLVPLNVQDCTRTRSAALGARAGGWR